jgi:hypothetical protein
MTRRHWIWALASGLGTCWLSGCMPDSLRQPVYFYPKTNTAPPARPADAAPPSALSSYQVSLSTNSSPKLGEPVAAEPPRPREPPPDPPQPPPQPAAEITLTAVPVRTDPPTVEALRCLMDKRSPEEALSRLDSCDPADREVLRELLLVTARLGDRDAPRPSPAEMAQLVEQMERLARALRPRAALVLDKLCFCRPRSIDTFGVFEPRKDDRPFRAGGPGTPGEHVQVYAEVRNFTSRPAGDHFETVLQGKLMIDGGQWQGDDSRSRHKAVEFTLSPCTDKSRTPRQDFFVNLHFDVPPGLPPGFYTLWVEVADVTPAPDGSRCPPRVARRSLDFRVAADAPAGR